MAAYFQAGLAAEEVLLGEARSDHGEKDLEEVGHLVAKHRDRSEEVRAAAAEAFSCVGKHRREINRLASRLAAPGNVEGEQLHEFLREVPVVPLEGDENNPDGS